MDYFFDEQISSDSNKLNNFKKLSKTFITQRDYESLNYIYELEKTSHRLPLSDKVYMEWIAALLDFYFITKRRRISRLEKAIKQLNDTDIHYLQILNSYLISTMRQIIWNVLGN
ncbi:MAG: hypothetical protein ACLUSV_03955 [Streptococcus sp.]